MRGASSGRDALAPNDVSGQQPDAVGESLADACHDTVVGLRVLLADVIHCLAGDHPQARAGACARAGEVRAVAEDRALGDHRSLAEGVEEVFIAVQAANDLDFTLLDDAHPLVGRRFVKQPLPGLPFAQPRAGREPAQILRVGADGAGRGGDGTFEHGHHGLLFKLFRPGCRRHVPAVERSQQRLDVRAAG